MSNFKVVLCSDNEILAPRILLIPKLICVTFQLRQIAKAQQADLSSGTGRQHQATHSTSVVVALQSRLASMTSDFKQV